MSETDKRGNVDSENVGDGWLGVFRRRERNLEMRIAVHAPGTVVSYNPANSTANILMGFLPILDTDLGDAPIPAIVIPKVRVAWPQGGGGMSYDTRPLVLGDTGELSFHDRALERWYLTGASPDPVDGRAHDLADATFVPGLAPDAKALKNTDMTARVIEAPLIKLGAAAIAPSGQLALAAALHTYMVALITAGIPALGDGGAALKTTMLTYLSTNPFTAFATTKTLAK